jgi:hypothetical protein
VELEQEALRRSVLLMGKTARSTTHGVVGKHVKNKKKRRKQIKEKRASRRKREKNKVTQR